MKINRYTNDAWIGDSDTRTVVYTEDCVVKKIMYESTTHMAGGGYAWSYWWDDADIKLQKLVDGFIPLWLAELRNAGVKI